MHFFFCMLLLAPAFTTGGYLWIFPSWTNLTLGMNWGGLSPEIYLLLTVHLQTQDGCHTSLCGFGSHQTTRCAYPQIWIIDTDMSCRMCRQWIECRGRVDVTALPAEDVVWIRKLDDESTVSPLLCLKHRLSHIYYWIIRFILMFMWMGEKQFRKNSTYHVQRFYQVFIFISWLK